jgi:hypothetical protein
MEKEFNSINQKIFARGLGASTSGKGRVVLDDDKIHCENKSSPSHSLKRKKHVQSNRWGVTLHSLVVSGSGIVVMLKKTVKILKRL